MLLFIYLIMHLLEAFTVESCAPYFRTAAWKKDASYYNFTGMCESTYVDLDSSVKRTSNQMVFYSIFASRAFVNYVCLVECQPQNDLSTVKVGSFKIVGKGTQADQIKFVIQCTYSQGSPCSKPYNWQNVEDKFIEMCGWLSQTGTSPNADGTTVSGDGTTIGADETTVGADDSTVVDTTVQDA